MREEESGPQQPPAAWDKSTLGMVGVVGSNRKTCGADLRTMVDIMAGYSADGMRVENQALFISDPDIRANLDDPEAIFGGLDDKMCIAPDADDNGPYLQQLVGSGRVYSGAGFTIGIMTSLLFALFGMCSGVIWAFANHGGYGYLMFGDEKLTSSEFAEWILVPWWHLYGGTKSLTILVGSCFAAGILDKAVSAALTHFGIRVFSNLVVIGSARWNEMSYATRFWRIRAGWGTYCHEFLRHLRRSVIRLRQVGGTPTIGDVAVEVDKDSGNRCCTMAVVRGDAAAAILHLPWSPRSGDDVLLRGQSDERSRGQGPWRARAEDGHPLPEELLVADSQGEPVPAEDYEKGWGKAHGDRRELQPVSDLKEAPERGRPLWRVLLDFMKRNDKFKVFIGELARIPEDVSMDAFCDFQIWMSKRVMIQVMALPCLRVFGKALKERPGDLLQAIEKAIEALSVSGASGPG